MIVAVVVSALLHLGILAFLDTLQWTSDEPDLRHFRIRVSIQPEPATPEPAQVVPQAPVNPTLPEPEKVAPPRIPRPIPASEEDRESVQARAPEPARRIRQESWEPGPPRTSPPSDTSIPNVGLQATGVTADPIPQDDNPRPQYPRKARRFGWEGTVLLTVEVLPDGSSGEIEIKESSGHRDLDRAAVAAIRRWRFTPAQKEGISVAAVVEIPVVFTLRE